MTAQLLALAERVEREPVGIDLWYTAYQSALGKKWPEGGTPASIDRMRFMSFCQSAAWLDAADMLRPVGWVWLNHEIQPGEWSAILVTDPSGNAGLKCDGTASGPHAEARARLAAALRAHAATNTGDAP